ncbi:MAG: hypothetical protein IKT40_07355 [Bacilli bacterium]|nr:hypothetical protein [Bacilli bacterium]
MLEGKIYIETDNYNDNSSELETYYADENAYIKALEGLMSGGVDDRREAHLNSLKTAKNSEKQCLNYAYCGCVLENEDIDSFIYHNINGDSFKLSLILNFDDCDEDFEYEYKIWRDNTNSIYKSLSSKSEYDIRIDALPFRDLKFSFINLSGGESYALLSGCTILDSTENKLLLRVENLTFTKGL